MDEDRQNVLEFANVQGKKVEADFEGGTVTSDGGALFLRVVETGTGVIRRLVDAVGARLFRHPAKPAVESRRPGRGTAHQGEIPLPVVSAQAGVWIHAGPVASRLAVTAGPTCLLIYSMRWSP